MNASLAIEMADEYLDTHRYSETWALVNMLRDELVREVDKTAQPPCGWKDCRVVDVHNVDTCPLYRDEEQW